MKKWPLMLLLVVNGYVYTQSFLPQATQQKIDQLFESINSTTPGYVVGAIKNGDFLFQKGYGMANLEHQIPISSQSAFNVASLSKQFTAACVALLILEEKLSLEDPIKKHLPGFPNYPHPIKIKHLIYMTSGLPEYYQQERANGLDWSTLQYFDIDTAIAASLKSKKLEFKPGKKWAYSNINYMLLTKIVQQVSGKPFADFARERLFEPMDMNHTFVNDDVFQVIPNRVLGYNHRDQENTQWLKEYGYLKTDRPGYLQINRMAPHYGGSGVYTTLEDLKKWVDNFESQSFGGEAFYNLMHQTMAFNHDKQNDAFGLVHGDFNGHPIIWYEGGDWGFSAYLMRFPEHKLSIIVLSNLGTGNARHHANRLMDILMDDGIVRLE